MAARVSPRPVPGTRKAMTRKARRRGIAQLAAVPTGWGFSGFAVALLAALSLATPLHAKPFACPRTGGEFVFALEANFQTLDQMASPALATRDIAMNIHETLIARDENNQPILELAERLIESADQLSYRFVLRQAVKFHNGKTMSSADVAASFARYAKMGDRGGIMANIAGWDTPGADSFVIRLKAPQPTFIERLSWFSEPIVIVPEESRDVPAGELTHPIGTGPFQIVEATPGEHVRLKRHDGYKPNASRETRTGFAGFKQACLDSVDFRIVTGPVARAEGLRDGSFHGVEDLPAKFLTELSRDPNVAILPLRNWSIQLASPNLSAPPTDNLFFRRAVQAVLDMDEIMEAATGGQYSLNAGFQYPNQATYAEAGKEAYNIKDPALAARLLAQSGYGGEPVILLTNKDYPPMYNAALAMQQQLQAAGINAQMKVVDWPTSVRMARDGEASWNFFFTGWGTQPALGPLATMRFFAGPNPSYHPPGGIQDPELLAAWSGMNSLPDPRERQAAFARMQAIVLEKVYAIPFGAFTKSQGIRANVKGFIPFRIPRMSNVWFAH